MVLPAEMIEEIVHHAREQAPNECCGIIATREGVATRLYRATNSEASPVRFVIDSRDLALDQLALDIIHEGMRQSVQDGTTRALNRSDVHIAGKTGTAQVGIGNEFINSWAVGYFPYENPTYVFVTLLEHGPRTNLFGSAPTMSSVINWLVHNRPEYLDGD